ncbi:hypothetical protein PGB90_004159 [Kerria lacca]
METKQESTAFTFNEINEALLMEEEKDLVPEQRPNVENGAGSQSLPPPVSMELNMASNASMMLLKAVMAVTTIPD